MSRRATVKPDWLDHALITWGLRSLNKHAGWYSINPMLKDGIRTGRPPPEPYEMGADDHRQLEQCIADLTSVQRDAITRAYKPWTARAIDELRPASTSTWCERLKAAARVIESKMRIEAAV